MKTLLVTGSSGLIGSEVCIYFAEQGYIVHGIDNNQRAVFFGPQGDTRWNQKRLNNALKHFHHHEIDIRDRIGICELLSQIRPSAIIHAAAQPSHDLAARIPFDDFDTNAVGTLNLLEAARQTCPESPFIHMSTNKVYGDAPNHIALKELDTRWDYDDPGVQTRHSRNIYHRPIQTLPLRRIQSCRRYYGTGIRALFFHAHLLLARRMPHRPQSQRR